MARFGGLHLQARNVQIELGAGYAFNRKFDFHRAEEGFETDEGAPFAKLEMRDELLNGDSPTERSRSAGASQFRRRSLEEPHALIRHRL